MVFEKTDHQLQCCGLSLGKWAGYKAVFESLPCSFSSMKHLNWKLLQVLQWLNLRFLFIVFLC